jgi:tRNA-dihydrouridine synthase
MAVALRHVEKLIAYKGERVGVAESRKHVAWYLTGMHGAAEVRQRINQAKTAEEFLAILRGYMAVAAA